MSRILKSCLSFLWIFFSCLSFFFSIGFGLALKLVMWLQELEVLAWLVVYPHSFYCELLAMLAFVLWLCKEGYQWLPHHYSRFGANSSSFFSHGYHNQKRYHHHSIELLSFLVQHSPYNFPKKIGFTYMPLTPINTNTLNNYKIT